MDHRDYVLEHQRIISLDEVTLFSSQDIASDLSTKLQTPQEEVGAVGRWGSSSLFAAHHFLRRINATSASSNIWTRQVPGIWG